MDEENLLFQNNENFLYLQVRKDCNLEMLKLFEEQVTFVIVYVLVNPELPTLRIIPQNLLKFFKVFLNNYTRKTLIYFVTLIIENFTNCSKIYPIFAANFPESFSKGLKFS